MASSPSPPKSRGAHLFGYRKSISPLSASCSSLSQSNFASRSSSPTRFINFYQRSPFSSSPPSPSARFLIDRPSSPRRSISARKQGNTGLPTQKRACMCSPTTHPGSFRCSMHRGTNLNKQQRTMPYSSSGLNFRRSAMVNSLVRIGGVEGGDLVKRALSTLIRPSSHQQRRREDFRARPSRLSVMSRAEDL